MTFYDSAPLARRQHVECMSCTTHDAHHLCVRLYSVLGDMACSSQGALEQAHPNIVLAAACALSLSNLLERNLRTAPCASCTFTAVYTWTQQSIRETSERAVHFPFYFHISRHGDQLTGNTWNIKGETPDALATHLSQQVAAVSSWRLLC